MASNYDDDDDVGYGKPPKKHRFKKGSSGNPKGRPREVQAPSLRSELMTALGARVTVKVGGHARRVTMRRAIAERLVNKAAMGDTRAILTLEQLAHQEEQVKIAAQNKTTRFTLKLGERNLRPGDTPSYEDDDLE